MKVDKDTIQYIARLAKLKFTESEEEELTVEFEKVLGYFENIDKEELTGVDLNPEPDQKSVLRKDEVRSFGNQQELFQNAKEMRVRDGFVVIPKVLE